MRTEGEYMPRRALENLTESMFYVLMAFQREPMCGIDVANFIEKKTKSYVQLGPATLYTILGRFEKEKYIKEIAVDGRKRIYSLTEKGRKAYLDEVERLNNYVNDAESENSMNHE